MPPMVPPVLVPQTICSNFSYCGWSNPRPFMAAVDDPPNHLQHRKRSPFAVDGPHVTSTRVSIMEGPSKALYLRHIKGKSLVAVSYFIHL